MLAYILWHTRKGATSNFGIILAEIIVTSLYMARIYHVSQYGRMIIGTITKKNKRNANGYFIMDPNEHRLVVQLIITQQQQQQQTERYYKLKDQRQQILKRKKRSSPPLMKRRKKHTSSS